jgi:hypothetical protein
MSTNNNASQTLFRFVSLRNPQLTETKRRNLGFIHRPSGVKGLFDEAIASDAGKNLKLNVLSEVARQFDTASFKTEKEIETSDFGQLLIIGRKISKNEKLDDFHFKFTKTFYGNLIDLSNKELNSKGLELFQNLWNNFIYQVVTQKDFYTKEAIGHVLKALHIGFAQHMEIDEDVIKANGEKEPLENALIGKIVLPKYLFSEDNGLNVSTSDTSRSTSEDKIGNIAQQRLISQAEKNLVVSKATYRKESLIQLKSELKSLQEDYNKDKNEAYENAYSDYLKTYGEALQLFERKVLAVEKRITPETSEEEKEKLYESLKEFVVQPFEFNYFEELSSRYLQQNLSPKSFDLFVEIFLSSDFVKLSKSTPEAKSKIIAEIGANTFQANRHVDTLQKAIDIVEREISSESQIAIENGRLQQEQYVNVGGAAIPVVNNTSKTPLAYSFVAYNYYSIYSEARSFADFSFEVEDTSWNVSNAKISADTDLGHVEEKYSHIAVSDDKITFPTSLINKFQNINRLLIEVIFSNGREAYMELSRLSNKEVYTGKLILKGAAFTDAESQKEGSKRKHFGIKRLGVADYLKVVQSVHAYVPGEVSNIENVMASELRHKSSVARDYSEITDTTSKSQETEKTSDTGKTSRADMQTEVAKELERQQAFNAHTRYSFDGLTNKFEIGADYANNTAQHDSTRQAVMKSQEITEKAMEKVLTKISEERVQKIIKEYTETNVHEFDNRGKVTNTDSSDTSPKHITGVYRWIDKKMKNQIYNYGKRTMFEFMIPEPAKLHRLSSAVSKGHILTAPVDPRKAERPHNMPNPKAATKELLEYWAQIYGVQLTDLPKEELQINHNITGSPNTTGDFGPIAVPINITQNYTAKKMSVKVTASYGWFVTPCILYIDNGKGGLRGIITFESPFQRTWDEDGLNLEGTFNFTYRGKNVKNVSFGVTLTCKLSETFMQQWYTENFNAIITAYEAAYKKFLDDQAKLDAEQKDKEAEAKEKSSNFYRYMEHDVLKHNCVAYLLQDYLNVLGQNFTNGDKMENFEVYLNEDLDKYTALAKFLEQAFEWEIMDYTFYPYYWANRKMWQEMYVSESVDPLFRSFLQAGMARVIVTVKPGFEDAVQFFLTTGKIWNGGEVPVIGDPLYMSIVDEMRQPTGKAQGKFWITRLPTTLTILQDKSTGLPVDQPLPIFHENNPENCENPMELESDTSFVQRDIQLNRSDKTESTLPKD